MAGNISSAVKPLPSLPPPPHTTIIDPRSAQSTSPVSSVRGHCAKLCSNGDGVTLICLSPLLHTLARYTTCIVVPYRYGVIPRRTVTNPPRRGSIDLPTDRPSQGSIDPRRRDTQVLTDTPNEPLLASHGVSLNPDSHRQRLELASLT